MSNKEIAAKLFVAEWTVRTHVSNILGKLHLARRTQAALHALRTGLASLDDVPAPDSTLETGEDAGPMKELALLNSLAAVVSGLVDPGEILRVALQKITEAFRIETGEAYGLDEKTGTLVMLAHSGLSEEFVRRTERLPLETALAGRLRRRSARPSPCSIRTGRSRRPWTSSSARPAG
jgi:hypothetical protein